MQFDLFPILSLRNQPTFPDATTGFLLKWCLRKKWKNFVLMTHHYPDLGSASDWLCHMGDLLQPIRRTTQIWVVMHQHQDLGSSASSVWVFCARFSKSVRWETSGGFPECRLFSQAMLSSSSVDIFPLPSLSALLHSPSILPFSFLFFSHFLPLSSLPLACSLLFFCTPSLSSLIHWHIIPSLLLTFPFLILSISSFPPLPYLSQAAFNIWRTFVVTVCNRLQVRDAPPRCSLLAN